MLLAIDTSTAQVGLALYDGDSSARRDDLVNSSASHYGTGAGSFRTFESVGSVDGHALRFGSCHWARFIHEFASRVVFSEGTCARASFADHGHPNIGCDRGGAASVEASIGGVVASRARRESLSACIKTRRKSGRLRAESEAGRWMICSTRSRVQRLSLANYPLKIARNSRKRKMYCWHRL